MQSWIGAEEETNLIHHVHQI